MPTVITRACPLCHTKTEIVVDNAKCERWERGEHIQDVWPEKTAMERETMMSGVCSDKCWDELWGEDGD